MVDADAIRQRWEAVGAKLDERGRRLFAAAEARTAGWRGLAITGDRFHPEWNYKITPRQQPP
jgi:hypothetical protein